VSDFDVNLERRLRDLDVEIAAREASRDAVAETLALLEDQLGEQKNHRAQLRQIQIDAASKPAANGGTNA